MRVIPGLFFLRPENGDVVAHFANIDGEFIAVSSLNNEIYRGVNIRNIVDQMLDRYPLLIPQPKNGSRILLHPTAALTAFLAAAFIMSIEGVKATSVPEVLVNVLLKVMPLVIMKTGLVWARFVLKQ